MNKRKSLTCDITSKPILDGNILLILNSSKGEKKVSLYMKLLEACPRHDAILYRDEECTFRYGQFNYARCLVEMVNGSTRFYVHERDGKTGLLFEASCPSEASKWISAFQGRMQCPYSPLSRRNEEHEHCATTKNSDLQKYLTTLDIPFESDLKLQ